MAGVAIVAATAAAIASFFIVISFLLVRPRGRAGEREP
jgi:branched-subunit amino acid ABC-type transport system permease component